MTHHTTNRAVRNVFFSGVRLAIGIISTVCTSAILARTLGPGNMGIYGYAMWLVGTLGILANIGLPSALTKFVSEYMGRGDGAMAAHLGKRLLLTQLLVALLVSAVTACFVLLKTPYRNVIVLAAIMVLLQALQQGLVAALAGVQKFDKIAMVTLYVSLAQVASIGVAALLHSGVLGMLWATLIGLAVGAWLSYRAVDRLLLKLETQPASLAPEMSDLYSRIRKFSLTISYVLLLDTIVWQRSEVLFLKWYSTLAEIAFYTLAYSIVSKMNDVASVFAGTLLPLYSESYGRSGLGEVGFFFRNSLKYLQMGMVPLCALGFVVAKPLVLLLYGVKFLPLVVPLQVLVVSLAVTSIGGVNSPLLLGIGKQGFIAKFGTCVAVLNLTLDFSLIPHYGALGAAVANCAAQIVGAVGGTFYVISYVKAKFPWRSTATIYVAAAIAAAPVYYCFARPQLGIPIEAGSVVIGALLYIGLLVVAGELEKSDWGVLRGAFLAKIGSAKPAEANDIV
jgi:O-antigen/teichoic acid export membrane protein